MTADRADRFSAGEQGLGYLYQPRFALLQMLQLPEETSVFVEKDDDLDFVDVGGRKTLASLKHKASGERLTNLSTDFWKSVRIWLTRYNDGGRIESTHRFYLFTTNAVSETSFLREFLPTMISRAADDPSLVSLADAALAETGSELIQKIANELHTLNESEQIDFWRRITIFDRAPRIDDIPGLIKDRHMRSIRREYRDSVFEHLEGWWHDIVLALLTGKRLLPIYGYEVSDKLTAFADEYKADNLPITFRGKVPDGEIDTDNDDRLFVRQLREIGISSARIRNAILDYYRAYEQRSAWARENLLVSSELEDYEDRLEDEWSRYRDVVFEKLDRQSAESVLREAGQRLYQWADLESGNISSLRIRERVTEPYVVRGCFHILANITPLPRIYWHPLFVERLRELLAVNA
jgi:C-terminal domain 7 of the ABC-three component (ABC-3C) systems